MSDVTDAPLDARRALRELWDAAMLGYAARHDLLVTDAFDALRAHLYSLVRARKFIDVLATIVEYAEPLCAPAARFPRRAAALAWAKERLAASPSARAAPPFGPA